MEVPKIKEVRKYYIIRHLHHTSNCRVYTGELALVLPRKLQVSDSCVHTLILQIWTDAYIILYILYMHFAMYSVVGYYCVFFWN